MKTGVQLSNIAKIIPPPMMAGTAKKTKIPNLRLTSIRVEPPFLLEKPFNGLKRAHLHSDRLYAKKIQYFQWD